MAFFQGLAPRRVLTPPRALSAGVVMMGRFDFTFSTAFAFAADQLELGVLPAFATPVDAILIGNAGGANNGSIGLMSGTEVGEVNGARTTGAELFSAVSINATVTRLTLATGLNIAPVGFDRSIGFSCSANITASAANNVSLILLYVM